MVPTVIYDADCRLCETCRQWIGRWDRRRRLQFLHFEAPEAIRRQPDLRGLGCLTAFRFLDEAGRVSEGARAAIEIVRRLPGGRPMAGLLAVPGVYRLMQTSYQWIAAHRYRLFGRVMR